MRKIAALALLCALAPWGAGAQAAGGFVLQYQGTNKWVAAEDDNKPLRALLDAAARGIRHYSVVLPQEDRGLALQRLEVLQDLLAKRAKDGVLIEEASGSTPAGTLEVTPKP